MDSVRQTDECERRTTRWGGFLVGIGAASTLVAIVIYLTSGAVTPADASATTRADALASAGEQVALMAYLSIPAGLAMILGAVLLATLPAATPSALVRRLAWCGAAFSSLLILQFDLLLPHLIIPLAARVEEAPVVFETVYRASDYVHSVGLVVAYTAYLAVFLVEARAIRPVVAGWFAYGGATMWSLALVVGISLILGRPLFLVAPAVLVGWASLAVLGFRMAAVPDAHAEATTEGRPVS